MSPKLRKFSTLLRWLFLKYKYSNIIRGTGKIYHVRQDCFFLNKNCRIVLNGNLNLSSLSFNGNNRSSILRMDEESSLICNGFNFSYGSDIILFPESRLELGKNSYINCDCKIRCHKEIIIGEGCAISHDFTIMDSDAHELNGIRNQASIHIGNHVWIGTRVTILKGVSVGDGAVIAAGSLVTNDIPPRTLAGGVPAKILKEEVEWKQ